MDIKTNTYATVTSLREQSDKRGITSQIKTQGTTSLPEQHDSLDNEPEVDAKCGFINKSRIRNKINMNVDILTCKLVNALNSNPAKREIRSSGTNGI